MVLEFQGPGADEDLLKFLKEKRWKIPSAVISNWHGNSTSLEKFLDNEVYIGISGDTLKTKESSMALQKIPMERVML